MKSGPYTNYEKLKRKECLAKRVWGDKAKGGRGMNKNCKSGQ